jgi:peroxiredoxin (alkyl hydroperoxide reductase subunit C)
MDTYDPAAGEFGKFSLEEAKRNCRWTVLVFYPADFTFVCPTELADLAVVHSQLRNLGCDVYGVSTDTKFAHLAWRNSEKLLADVHYPLAADPTGAVSKIFGVYDSGSGLALRGTFIIDKEGVIRWSVVNGPGEARDSADYKAALAAL